MRLAGARGLYGFTHQNGAIGVVLQAIGEAARLGRSPDWIRETAEDDGGDAARVWRRDSRASRATG